MAVFLQLHLWKLVLNMSKSSDVLQMLIPTGGWVTSGHDYEGIQFIDCEPITKAQFDKGVVDYDAWIAAKQAQAAADKAALLAKLGMNEDDLKTLLS